MNTKFITNIWVEVFYIPNIFSFLYARENPKFGVIYIVGMFNSLGRARFLSEHLSLSLSLSIQSDTTRKENSRVNL